MQIGHHQDTRAQANQAVFSVGTAGHKEAIASSGVSFRLWRLYQHAWLVCLAFPLIELVQKPITLWHLTLGLLALTGFATGYTWLMWPHPATLGAQLRSQSRISWLCFGILSTLTLVFSLIDGPSFLWLFIGLSALAGLLFPQRKAFAVIVVLTLSALALAVTMNGGIARVDWWWLIAFLLLVRGIGLDMIGVARMGSAIRELHIARRELARLAVIEERERLARDLHDLLGQTLSMISLKSELARCLIEEDPRRCAQELSEIEQVGRMTLREVRKTVAGYRQPRLSNEVDGARQLLEAAGISCEIKDLNVELPQSLDAALAWTVREGVTNVIRHSRARQCWIRLKQREGFVEVEVLNDGGERRPEERVSRRGSGIAGLRERISLLGGKLEAGPLLRQEKEHFHVFVQLPFRKQGEASASQEEGS
ncbi:MAG TPA: sensor histidine kinase [Ktedonobacteraceae bacterium]|nr:sensor histidine kinase [Ktedonobacteraceae bacterium]